MYFCSYHVRYVPGFAPSISCGILISSPVSSSAAARESCSTGPHVDGSAPTGSSPALPQAAKDSAIAAHSAIKDYGTLGDNPATTLLINSAKQDPEYFQFGTYEDPYGNLTISEMEFGAYCSRDCFIKNKTGYRVWLTLWGVAQSNYKSFKWY